MPISPDFRRTFQRQSKKEKADASDGDVSQLTLEKRRKEKEETEADMQLKRALDYLKSWYIFKETIKKES